MNPCELLLGTKRPVFSPFNKTRNELRERPPSVLPSLPFFFFAIIENVLPSDQLLDNESILNVSSVYPSIAVYFVSAATNVSFGLIQKLDSVWRDHRNPEVCLNFREQKGCR